MRTIRWGMIGCGDVTEVKSGPAFNRVAGSRLVAVMRRNGALAADYARRHGVPRWYDNADAILHAPDIDAVYVATLPDSHCEYAVRCATAGKPVYVEKPMGMNAAQCETMIDACKAAQVPLWVGYYRRALPRFLRVKTLVESGTIGAVRIVVSRQLQPLAEPSMPGGDVPWRINAALSGGGLFFDMACHTLDFLDFLFGPISDVRAFAANAGHAYRPEDLVVASYRFESGVFGSGTWCYCADREEEMNEIVGTQGRLLFSTTKAVPIRIVRGTEIEEIPVDDPPHVHQPMIDAIVAELNGHGACPSTGVSAARTARVMDHVLCEFRSGGMQ